MNSLIYILLLWSLVKCDHILFQNYASDKSNLWNVLNIHHVYKQHMKYNHSNESITCKGQIKKYVEAFRINQEWALMMYDASSKLQSGLFMGNLENLGHFDECMLAVEPEHKHIRGKFCQILVYIPDILLSVNEKVSRKYSMYNEDFEGFDLTWSLCVIEQCNIEELFKILNREMEELGISIYIDDSHCVLNKPIQFKLIDILVIAFLGAILCIIIISTFYDLYKNKNKKDEHLSLFTSFSLVKNGNQLFKIVPVTSKSHTIQCIHGIRFLTMLWIILIHRYERPPLTPIINSFIFNEWLHSFNGSFMLASTVTVDTFFVISGLLVSYNALKNCQVSDTFEFCRFYIHRYLRLTPALVVMILIQLLSRNFGNGPVWHNYIEECVTPCFDYWWSALLYIQNYINPVRTCLGQTWYLSVDMQLFWISPIIIYPMWKCKTKYTIYIYSFYIFITTAVLCVSIVINKFPAAVYFGTENDVEVKENIIYYSTHARALPWLIGVGFGYILHNLKDKQVHLKRLIIVLLWTFSFLSMITATVGLYPFVQLSYEYNLFLDTLYQLLQRSVWSLAICWIIYACHYGYGGIINSLLSSQIWQPFSKLTFCVFLIHFPLQAYVDGFIRSPENFGFIEMMYKFLGDTVVSILFALPLVLFIEFPLLNLEKNIFYKVSKADIVKKL